MTMRHPIIMVHLRQPKKSNSNESRDDPFWEFGSFGCTGCHGRNLMNPKRADELEGARLAFAQGGKLGFKLVLLTPPIWIDTSSKNVQARWNPTDMPFRYEHAPLLINNNGDTDFPILASMLEGVLRDTPVARFSSIFRTRRRPLPVMAERYLARRYKVLRDKSDVFQIAEKYYEALPYMPNSPDSNRKRTYNRILKSNGSKTKCKPRMRS